MKKQPIGFAILLITLSIFGQVSAQSTDSPPENYRKLPDIHVFADQSYGQWAGSGNGMEIETVDDGFNPAVPIDAGQQHNNLPSYRVNVTGENGWWGFILAGQDWETYSIAPYYPDGALEFNVKGDVGGEDFQVSLISVDYERDPEEAESTRVTMSEMMTISDQWQSVQIPLTDFLADAGSLNLNQLRTVHFAGVNGSPVKFWLNDIRFTSTAVEPGHPAIKINQLGYLSDARKQALVTGFPEELTASEGTTFEVRQLPGNAVAFEGTLQLRSEFDGIVSGERILVADFSDLTTPGEYYLAVDAFQMADSPSFVIGPLSYDNLLVDAMRYFYLQRSGIALDARYAGQFARGVGHPQDAQAEFRSGELSPRNVSGGWYDAGDYGKYVNAGATAVSDLLWAYELFPAQFPDDQLNIPESGNGVSDLLDEVRWELDWILKMQDPESGGFYHMVQPTEDVVIPAATETRYIEDVDGGNQNVRPTSTTGSAVAALAHAALVYANVDPGYAAVLQTAAESGWAYLEANPNVVESVPGPYADNDDRDDRFWAAAALYRLTGDAAYDAYIQSVYQDVPTLFDSDTDNGYGVGMMGMIGWLCYASSDNPNPEAMAFFEPLFSDWSARMAQRWQNSAWNLTLLDEDYYWGSNYVTLTTPLVMLVGAQALGLSTDTAVHISQNALDYLLGTNPLRFSYVSGYGLDSLRHPHSQQWSRDGVPDVPKGVLAGGPNEYTNPLLFSNFAGKKYVDSNGAWSINEHTIYWNSALVFHAALAAYLGNPSGAPLPVSEAPAATAVSSSSSIATPVPAESQPVEEIAAVRATAVPPAAETAANAVPDPRLNYVFIALGVLALFVVINFVFMVRIWRKIS
ncbi:MAG: glycoside hydrolase family 9 protein [Ardenticatenaceae bacterium]|nr:glycoside hydrolase family 9 protein [Ardenticatenaceae bacterium]MCB9443806.1 glycoside hydrolase family 9 protein [Ardenticatenaceae bacterium]